MERETSALGTGPREKILRGLKMEMSEKGDIT